MNPGRRKHRQSEVRNVESPATIHQVLICIGLALLVAMIYLSTLGHDFVGYDDNQYITKNPIVQQGLTVASARYAFTTFDASNWHPLTWLSHMADVQLWGMWAGGHHLTNVLLHAANSALVFLVLVWMTGTLWRPAFVAAIFAVHPLHVESVAWVSERKDVLSTLFGLLAIALYVQHVSSPKLSRYILVMALFALSLLAKPMLVTLPCVLLLLDWWPLNRLADRAKLAGLLVEKIPLLILSIASSVMTILAQSSGGAVQTLERLPLATRLANAAVAYITYMLDTVWPSGLAVIYPLPDHRHPGLVIASVAVILLISVAVAVLGNRRRWLVVGWLWFVGTLVPVIGLVQVGVQASADRYMYVPMIGLLIMVAWSVPATMRRAQRVVLASVVAASVLALTIASMFQVSRWQNTLTLFNHAIAVTDRNHVAHNVLGVALREAGRNDEAREHIRRALELRPDYAAAHNNMGLLLFDSHQPSAAEMHFRESVRLKPDASVWNNLGHAQLAQGKYGEAEPSFTQAINMGLATAEVHAGLGAAYWNTGQRERAEHHLQQALVLRPDLIDARITYGVALAARGELEQAIAEFQEALRRDPTRSDAQRYLDTARAQQNAAVP